MASMRSWGSYEIGRSKRDIGSPFPKLWSFASETKREGWLEPMETPGPDEYDPHAQTGLAATTSMTFNRTQQPFGGTSKREFQTIMGREGPGPAKYITTNRDLDPGPTPTMLKSGVPQRPPPDKDTPGVGAYNVVSAVDSILPDRTNPGCMMCAARADSRDHGPPRVSAPCAQHTRTQSAHAPHCLVTQAVRAHAGAARAADSEKTSPRRSHGWGLARTTHTRWAPSHRPRSCRSAEGAESSLPSG